MADKKKVSFTIHVQEANGLYQYEGKEVFVIWKRGKKKENEGKTPTSLVSKNSASWKSSLKINATLFPSSKSPTGFKEKTVKFHLRVIEGAKGKEIAKCQIDLAKSMDEEQIPFTWLERPTRSFESLLKSNPATLKVWAI